MQAIWKRGDQDQMNVAATPPMIGAAGKVVVLADRVFITCEDVTAEMVTADKQIGLATAGIWQIEKGTVAFSQFAEVFVTTGGEIGVAGTFIGIAEKAVATTDETVMVLFSSFAQSLAPIIP